MDQFDGTNGPRVGMRAIHIGRLNNDNGKFSLLMSGPYRLLRGNLCVAIEIPARLVGRGFICSVWRIHSIHGHTAKVDKFFDSGLARNLEDVLGALNIGSQEFIPVSGLPDKGGTMKYKIASNYRFT